jgi:hypothetical protein
MFLAWYIFRIAQIYLKKQHNSRLLYKFVHCWIFVTQMGVIGGWLDTFAHPKRYDRYDFRGYCLVAIVGGDDPLKRSFGSVFFGIGIAVI